MGSFAGTESPAEARERWHSEAAQRDEAYLAQGPADMAETTDGPWSGGAAEPVGEWRAFLSWPDGYITTDPDEQAEMFEDARGEISIRRASALPDEDGKLPGTWQSLDIFAEVDLENLEPEEGPHVWELAKKAAWGMSLNLDELLAGFREDLVNGLDAAMGACHHEQVSSEWDLCNACAADTAVKVLRELLAPAVTAGGSDQEAEKEN